MNTTTTTTTISPQIVYLRFVTNELNRYIPLTFLILGTFGNILNLMIFSHPSLRTNSCSNYFISGSVVNLISLYVGLITPFLGLYGLDPTQKVSILCKLRFYFRFVTITLSTWFILFACIDRYFSTSKCVVLRSWSSVRMSQRLIIGSSIFCLVVPYSQVFYCLTVTQRNVCTYTVDTCKFTLDGVLLLCNSGVPPMLIVLLTILTIRNVRQVPKINVRVRRNVQLIRIVLIQVIVLVFFSVPITSQKIYNFISITSTNDTYRTALNSLINQIATELSYINTSIAFYVYSLSTKRFRQEVRRIICPWQKARFVHPK